MMISKFDRKALGLSVPQVAERSGLKVDRVKELEDAYLDLIGRGVNLKEEDAKGDAEKYLAVLSSERREQDKTVEAMVGKLLSSGMNVSVTLANAAPASGTYQVEISKSHLHGKSLSSFGRGLTRLTAVLDAVDSMREAVGIVSPFFAASPIEDAA